MISLLFLVQFGERLGLSLRRNFSWSLLFFNRQKISRRYNQIQHGYQWYHINFAFFCFSYFIYSPFINAGKSFYFNSSSSSLWDVMELAIYRESKHVICWASIHHTLSLRFMFGHRHDPPITNLFLVQDIS